MEAVHYPNGIMAIDSKKILGINQNYSASLLDLLVRESIQNSLDATNGPAVQMDFRIGQYNADLLKPVFSDLEHIWNFIPKDFISVGDKGTTGLTGPTLLEDVVNRDDKGNYISLVKGLMDNAKVSGSGGSWGIGKTIYYRMGINFVIFYSRIAEGMQFEERLSAVWIDSGKGLLNPTVSNWRGISLWGKRHVGKTSEPDVLPISDQETISTILTAFGLNPYTGNETGTLIIIPGISTSSLIDGLKPESEEIWERMWWTHSIEEYLRISIQRWYTPRLAGTENPNALLIPSVNGKPIEQLLPLFQKIQDIYNSTYLKNPEINHYAPIRLKSENGNNIVAGHLAWAEYEKSDLKRGELFDDPYLLAGINRDYDEKGFPPIVIYTRKPGMFPSYDDQNFQKKVPSADDDRYRIVIFRLDPDADYPTGKPFAKIEDYVRYGEKSDHFHWFDSSVYNTETLPRKDIILKIQNNIGRIFNDALSKESARTRGKRLTVGRSVANVLFPPGGFYVQKSTTSGRLTKTRRKTDARPELKIECIEQQETHVELRCRITFHNEINAKIAFGVSTPGMKQSVMNEEAWKEQFGDSFPFSILSVEVTRCKIGTEIQNISLSASSVGESIVQNRLSLNFKSRTSVVLRAGSKNAEADVIFKLSRCGPGIVPQISLIDKEDARCRVHRFQCIAVRLRSCSRLQASLSIDIAWNTKQETRSDR